MHIVMKRIFTQSLLILALFVAGLESAKALDKKVTISVDGKSRSYRIHVPNNCPTGVPLVIAMHGTGGSMDNQQPGFNDIADTEKFVVAYPQGENIYFPVFGATLPGWASTGEDNGDAAFLRAIVDDMVQNYQVDRKRVYCCGFSNGGMNTYAMANVCSDVFAAFASISGFPLNEFHLRHVGKRPVPFLHIHGKQDDFVRYALMPTIVDQMVARMGANPVPVKTSVSGKYDKSVYEAMDGSFPYVYYEINNMGHEAFTNDTEDGNSSLTMWKFFRQYTLDTPRDISLKWMPRIEAEGYNPKDHGWTVNARKTLLQYGVGDKTDANQNVYHSLQFAAGHYKLCFKSQGEAGKTVAVKLQHLKPMTVVFEKTVAVGEDATLFFDIDEEFGEYRLTFSREDRNDEITITDIAVYSTDGGETGIGATLNDKGQKDRIFYDLQGRKVSEPTRGLYIVNGKKVVVK